jgi:hypothetical protein
MKDFLKKYHNKKNIWNLGIIVASLIMAIWINIFLVDWTEMWTNLKASVLWSTIVNNEIKADIYLERNNSEIVLKNSKNISNTESISFSLTYNPTNVTILEIKSDIWEVIKLWESNSWIETIIISNISNNIDTNTILANIITEKQEDKSEQLNLINANFRDLDEEGFELSTSWITF